MFESTASYKAAMKAVQLGGVPTTTPASAPIARKKATINAVTQGAAELCPQHDDDADDGVSSPAADVLERVAAVLGNASPSMVAVVSDAIVRSGLAPALVLSADEVGAMRQLINGSPSYVAAVGAARRPPQDDEWVKKHGVEGFKSPADINRDPLHIGEICKAAGIKVPANCPKDPHALTRVKSQSQPLAGT
jgi:hypothetical protein